MEKVSKDEYISQAKHKIKHSIKFLLMTTIANMPGGKLRCFLLHQLFENMLQCQVRYRKNTK
jgi:hypothetical protein